MFPVEVGSKLRRFLDMKFQSSFFSRLADVDGEPCSRNDEDRKTGN